MTSLNLEPLEKAIDQLKSGIKQCNTDPENELLRDGVIQRFEYTMDLSWKLLQRYLKHIAQIDESAIRTKNDLFREAAVSGLFPPRHGLDTMRPEMKPPIPMIPRPPKGCLNGRSFSFRTQSVFWRL